MIVVKTSSFDFVFVFLSCTCYHDNLIKKAGVSLTFDENRAPTCIGEQMDRKDNLK